MTINERVSDLIRSEIADFFAGFGNPGEPDIQSGEAQRQLIARIDTVLQQYRAAAEPMYQAKFSLGWRDVTKEQYDDNAAHGAPVRIVYAAPQVTSVPDEMTYEQARDITSKKSFLVDRDSPASLFAAGYNACRMDVYLAAPAVQADQQEPVSQPYTLPECFERLFKHAQGLTFGDDWNRGTAAKYHRDLLIKAVDDCRGAIASGNYPAIPDYWTGSDKANAALVMLDRIDTLDPVDDDRIEGIKRIIRELAAAPKQEAE